MVKIYVTLNNHTRTFYTRKDWKQGKKLYLYRKKYPKLTGNWYTDPNYGHWSWQDYEREYAEQCNGETSKLEDYEIKMKRIVDKYNDYILELALNGIAKINLDNIEEMVKK